MAKLTDTHIILLSSAAQRADGSLLPPPATLGAVTDHLRKAVAALIKRTYADEVPITMTDHAWRVDGDQQYGAVITDAGCAAISIEPIGAGKLPVEPAQPPEPTSTANAGRPTKAALVLTLLQRVQGATLAELVETTGWLPHTTRAALTGIRKKGHDLAKNKRGDLTCYTLAA